MSQGSELSQGLKVVQKSTRSQRSIYISALNSLLSRSFSAIDNHNTPRRERLAWSRVAVSALSVGIIGCRDEALDEIRERIRKLEEILKMDSAR